MHKEQNGERTSSLEAAGSVVFSSQSTEICNTKKHTNKNTENGIKTQENAIMLSGKYFYLNEHSVVSFR